MAEKYLKAGIVLGASLAIFAAASQPASAQMRYQTPRGDQTVAPSQMPQQPSLSEDFANPSKQNLKSSPPGGGPDMPGLPSVEPPGRKPTTGPGMIMNGNDAQSTQMKVPDRAQNGQPIVNTPRTGGMVLPEGVPTSVRNGPVEDVPMWQRGLLGLFLLVNLVSTFGIAIALTAMKHRDVDLHGGHYIDPQTTDARTLGTAGSRY